MSKRRCRHFDPREAGAAISLRSDRGVSTTGSHVDSWTSTAGSVVANGSGSSRPQFSASSSSFGGFPALTFDGTNDTLSMTSTAAATFQNVGHGRIFAVAEDTNPTGGTIDHTIACWSQAGGGNTRFRIDTRRTAVAGLRSLSRRTDGSVLATTAASGTSVGVNVVDCLADWSGNALSVFLNGIQGVATTFSAGAGLTSNTASANVALGTDFFGTFFVGKITQITAFNTAIDLALAARIRHCSARTFLIPCS
jgi:hypothetical protein